MLNVSMRWCNNMIGRLSKGAGQAPSLSGPDLPIEKDPSGPSLQPRRSLVGSPASIQKRARAAPTPCARLLSLLCSLTAVASV